MVVVARTAGRREVGIERPVRDGGVPPYGVQRMITERGWSKREGRRARRCEDRWRGNCRDDRGTKGRRQGLPSPPDMGHSAIDADIESLYHRSPSRDLPYVTLAGSLSSTWQGG